MAFAGTKKTKPRRTTIKKKDRPKIKKTKTQPKEVDTSAYKEAASKGYMGAGYTPSDVRQKISQQNKGYTKPTKGGRLTDTSQGISTIQNFDIGKDGKSSGNVIDTTITATGTETGKEDEKEQVAYYDTGDGKISYRDLKLLESKIGQEAIIRDGKIFFIDKTGTGQMIPAFRMMEQLSGTLDKVFGFNPKKSFDTDNANTAASFATMFKNMDKEEFNQFLNRKGNLDRIMKYAGGLSQTENAKLMNLIKAGDPQALADRFQQRGMSLDSEKYSSYYDKLNNPEQYYKDNPPRTSGDLEELARLDAQLFKGDASFQNQIFAAREQARRDRGDNNKSGGVGDFQQTVDPTADPTTDTTSTNVPDFVLKRQYMPGFTPSYTGGPEQMQIAGGYYDPVTKKFIGDPYGTANQYQFAQGGIVGTSPLLFKNQGGMASDKGIKSFKKYGY